MQRIALFGTSADPPHEGHRGILNWLGHEFDHVAVWAADNPYKQQQSPLADRTAMLGLMTRLVQTPGTVQLHSELSHRYTVITLERAQRLWPGAEFTLVIGADLVQQLPKWYQAQDIFKQARILIFPRPGYPLDENELAPLRSQGATVAIATPPRQYNISSSAYRQCDRVHDIPAIIQNYIDEHHLYPCLENSTVKQPTHSLKLT